MFIRWQKKLENAQDAASMCGCC